MWRLPAAVVLLAVYVRAEENCSSVAVSGEGLEGTFNATSTGYTAQGTNLVLQAVEFGTDDDRRRRGLAGVYGAGAGTGEAASDAVGRSRALADEEPCPNKMWILANTSTFEDGYPYYAAFDCADNPADINSTWMLVTCGNCPAEIYEVVLQCLSVKATSTETESDDGDGSILTTPVIIAIAVGAVAIMCICVAVGWCLRKRTSQDTSTFESESELQERKMMSGGGDTGIVGDGGSTVVGVGTRSPLVVEGSGVAMMGTGLLSSGGQISLGKSSHTDTGGPGSRTSLKGAHVAPMHARSNRNNPSLKGSLDPASAYDGMFSSHAMSAHSGASTGMKDSMAAAAAAAGAAATRSSSGTTEKFPNPTVGFAGEPERAPHRESRAGVHEDRIIWSAGREMARGGRRNMPSEYGEDSAAGSEFSLNPDNIPDRAYYDSESMPASSPGGYSIYSHFTAGGHTIYPGDVEDGRYQDSDLSWNGDDASRRDSTHGRGNGRVAHSLPLGPSEYGDSVGDAAVAAVEALEIPPPEGAHLAPKEALSPAGLIARVDRSTREGSRRSREPQ